MADLTKIIFFGTPDFVVPVLRSLHQNFDLIGVITTPDKPTGRHQVLTPTPVKVESEKLGVKVLTPEKLDTDFIIDLKELGADLFVLASYGKIIPDEVLELTEFGMINIHPSQLPKYRGASPVQAAILNGDKTTGITIMKVDSQMDHGPILFQEEVEILPNETTEILLKRVFEKSSEILPKVINDYIEGKIEEISQDENYATYTWKTSETKERAYFDINNPPSPQKLDQMIRAFYPTPVVWTKWNDKIIKLYPEKQIQMEGKNKVSLEEFLRGYPDFPIKEL